jgi:hypothetical protein
VPKGNEKDRVVKLIDALIHSNIRARDECSQGVRCVGKGTCVEKITNNADCKGREIGEETKESGRGHEGEERRRRREEKGKRGSKAPP